MIKFNKKYALSKIIHAVHGLQNVDIYMNKKLFFNDIDFTNFKPCIYIPEGEYILEDFRKDEKENPLVKDVLSLLLGK